MDKRTSERVRKEGIRPLNVVAKDVVKKILKEHQVTPLDRDAEQEVSRIVKEAEREFLGKA
jgi:trimethylamine:corrinoid methyltransferase-like protein